MGRRASRRYCRRLPLRLNATERAGQTRTAIYTLAGSIVAASLHLRAWLTHLNQTILNSIPKPRNLPRLIMLPYKRGTGRGMYDLSTDKNGVTEAYQTEKARLAVRITLDVVLQRRANSL